VTPLDGSAQDISAAVDVPPDRGVGFKELLNPTPSVRGR
jgi:hypothetical protein